MSPGAWLTDMCQERYEVREKKSSKKVCGNFLFFIFYLVFFLILLLIFFFFEILNDFWMNFYVSVFPVCLVKQRPRGLKAMGSMESESE